jgi:hypothetical protein
VVDRPVTGHALLKNSDKQWTFCLNFGEHPQFAANQQSIREMNIHFTATASKVWIADPAQKENEPITAHATLKNGTRTTSRRRSHI